jgi:hypothetical protein
MAVARPNRYRFVSELLARACDAKERLILQFGAALSVIYVTDFKITARTSMLRRCATAL